MTQQKKDLTEEELRLLQVGESYVSPWEKWGPYVSEQRRDAIPFL